jgi:hypothetical protein
MQVLETSSTMMMTAQMMMMTDSAFRVKALLLLYLEVSGAVR